MTTNKKTQHSELLSVEEVAEALSCSKSHVYRLIAAKQLPYLNIAVGSRAKTRIPRANIDKFIADRMNYGIDEQL